MSTTRTRAATSVAAAAVAAAAFAGCGTTHATGTAAPSTTAAASLTPGTGTGAQPAQGDQATQGTQPGASSSTAAPASSPAAGGTKTTAASHATTTTAAPAGRATASTATTAANPATAANQAAPGGAPKPAQPGTYQVRQSGSFTAAGRTTNDPPTGTIVLDAPTADGTQVAHRYVQPGNDAADTSVQYRPTGPFITSTTQGSGGTKITCSFNPGIPAPPQPPTVGSAFSATGSCGSFTVAVKGSITGTKQVTLDGTTYSAVVIDSTLTFSGAITGTGTEEDWYVPALRLTDHQVSTTNGSYGAFQFQSSLTTDLVSAKPS